MPFRPLRSALPALMIASAALPAALDAQSVPMRDVPAETVAALRSGIARIFAAESLPGMSVVVVSDTGVLLLESHGFADIEARIPVTPRTLFYIASSTKSFTGLAAALLDRDGVLSLDAPLSRYLPELELHPPLSADSITIRALLTHTHGISNDGPIVFRTAFSGEHDPAMLGRLLAEHGPDERGTAFHYGNIGYNVASLAIDRATGRSWKEVLDELVLAPAGMRQTTAWLSRADRRLLAQPYAPADTGVDRIPYVKSDGNMHAAGGLVSSAADLARWLEVNINQGMLDGRRVFPADIMREVHRLQVPHGDGSERWPRHGYGLGWQRATLGGDTLVHHFGGFAGFDAHVSFMPGRRIGVAVLVNGGFGGGLMDRVSRYVYDVLAAGADPDAAARATVDELVPLLAGVRARIGANRTERRARPQELPHPLRAYAGTYENPSFGRMVWTVEDGRLAARIGALTSVAEAFRAAENVLRVELVPGSGSTVRFTVEGGRAVRLVWNDVTFERVG